MNLKVAQLKEKSDLETRIEALEKRLNKHLELENQNGPTEIRTQDFRRVKKGECAIYELTDILIE